jgi:hypothetical protein
MPDFLSTNLGSIVQLRAVSDAAVRWAIENVGMDPDLQPVLDIDSRYFLDIAVALLESGLTLQDSATGQMAELPATAA